MTEDTTPLQSLTAAEVVVSFVKEKGDFRNVTESINTGVET